MQIIIIYVIYIYHRPAGGDGGACVGTAGHGVIRRGSRGRRCVPRTGTAGHAWGQGLSGQLGGDRDAGRIGARAAGDDDGVDCRAGMGTPAGARAARDDDGAYGRGQGCRSTRGGQGRGRRRRRGPEHSTAHGGERQLAGDVRVRGRRDDEVHRR